MEDELDAVIASNNMRECRHCKCSGFQTSDECAEHEIMCRENGVLRAKVEAQEKEMAGLSAVVEDFREAVNTQELDQAEYVEGLDAALSRASSTEKVLAEVKAKVWEEARNAIYSVLFTKVPHTCQNSGRCYPCKIWGEVKKCAAFRGLN